MTSNSERWFPAFHVRAQAAGWQNDPNAPYYSASTGHLLFAQFNVAGGAEWGNIGWRAFSSADLVRWHDDGTALRPGTPASLCGL